MFIDYLTLLLINTVIGLTAAALFLVRGPDNPNRRTWASVLAASGLIALVFGAAITLTWPFPKSPKFNATFANMAFGEPSVLLGMMLMGTALSVAKGWDLRPMAVFSFFAGLVAVVLGIGILDLQITAKPDLAAAGFILAGAGGILAALALVLDRIKALRYAAAAPLLAAAVIWAITGYGAYWMHLELYSKP